MIGSILSMSRYAECREDVSLRQYKRILLVLTEKQAVQPLAEVVQHAEPDTIWGLIVIGDNELSVQRLRRQAEMLLKRPIALSAFIPASDVTEGVIRAAETIQPPPAAVPDSDSTAWQALETFLTSHTTGVLATGWGRNIRTCSAKADENLRIYTVIRMSVFPYASHFPIFPIWQDCR